MSNRKRELAKHRSEFEVRVRESINTMSRYLTMHRPCVEDDLSLLDGSILEDIRKRGKLRRHQIMAWMRWYSTVSVAHGHTDEMVVQYQERVDSSMRVHDNDIFFGEDNSPEDIQALVSQSKPHTYLTPAAVEFQECWEFLRNEEKGLVEQLTRDYYRVSGAREIHASTLPTLGFILSGYQDNRQSIAAGVTAIQRLLNSLAEFYGYPVFYY